MIDERVVGLRYVARGIGGVEEMRASLDDSKVCFGLLRFVFGRGTFARVKTLMVHWNGSKCPVVRRGRANASKPLVEDALSPFSTSVTFMEDGECTTDRVVEELYRVVVSDGRLGENGTTPKAFDDATGPSGSVSKEDMKRDIEEQLIEAKRMYDETRTRRLRLLTLREMPRKMSYREVQGMVRADGGAFNWLLCRADANGTEVFNAGGGSLEEMKKSLDDKEVLFGLLRMSFGTGVFRRTKFVLVHWSGDEVPALKRGHMNAQEEAIRRIIGPVNISHFATTLDELKLEDLIEKIKAKVVLDGESSEGELDLYSLEKFMVAVEEDGEALKREFPEAAVAENGGATEETNAEPTFREALESVLSSKQPYNWFLCELA